MSADFASLEVQLLQQRDALAGYILALTRDALAAEEIFQEVALAVLQEAKKGTQVQMFLPWAREMARRRVAAHYSSQKRRATLLLSDSFADIATQAFEENEMATEHNRTRQAFVIECLQALKGRARQLIDLRYRLGQTPPQIAAALNWTVNSVNVGLARARNAIQECAELKSRAQERM